MREQIEQLEHHPGLGADRGQLALAAAGPCRTLAVAIADLDAIDPDAALVVLLEQVDAAQQRGLAAAGWPDDGDHLAAMDVELDPLQHAVVAERLADVADADDRVRRGSGMRSVAM